MPDTRLLTLRGVVHMCCTRSSLRAACVMPTDHKLVCVQAYLR
jgi:hypothetical protein